MIWSDLHVLKTSLAVYTSGSGSHLLLSASEVPLAPEKMSGLRELKFNAKFTSGGGPLI